MAKQATAAAKASQAPAAQLTQAEKLEQNFEVKDRVYKLNHQSSPWLKLQCSDGKTRNHNDRLLWFDPDMGFERSLRYAVNQQSVFVDEHKGDVHLEPVIFEHGLLAVPKEQRSLQKLLSLYHPWNSDVKPEGRGLFKEIKADEEAQKQIVNIKTEAEALALALELDLATSEAILRPDWGPDVATMSEEQITRNLLMMAKEKPEAFIEAANSDILMLVNIVYKSLDFMICEIKGNVYKFMGKPTPLFKIPLGEDSYEAIGEWFKTDEGHEIMNIILNKIKKK